MRTAAVTAGAQSHGETLLKKPPRDTAKATLGRPRVGPGAFRIVAPPPWRQAGHMSEHITDTPSIKRLERSSQSKVIAGVSGGLGRYFDLNPMVFRLALVVLTVVGGAGILVYIAAVLIMPAEGEDASIAERVLAERSDHPARLVALGLVAVAVLVLLSDSGTWPSAGAGWVIVLLVGLVVLWASKERRARRIAIVAL